MLGGLLSPVSGVLGSLFGGVSSLYDGVQDVVEGLAPGSMDGTTTTGNLLNDNGAVSDLLDNLAEGDITGSLSDVYANVIGPGGVVHNLADGGGLGIEGLLGNTLGLADGILGSADGLTDDLPILGGSLL
ncbi:hypothetical protein [Paracoccus onubensis]|nr:hypothetical protein [Paracoccus onubensis]